MREYLSAVILEQINRGIYLKGMIPKPLQYSELSGLKNSCIGIIDENIEYLKFLKTELEVQQTNELRSIIRGIRTCTRDLGYVESYGISALYYQPKEKKFLNTLAFEIHKEIKYPLPHPVVACLSTQYYFFNPFMNVIFIPFGESEFLLHLPDIFHELGHSLFLKRENESHLSPIADKYELIIEEITKYYQRKLSELKRDHGPQTRIHLIKLIHSYWKNWIDEFLCDLFALYTLGPAYVFSHLHLVTKKSKEIYEFYPFFRQTHPSDASRMEMLLIGLRLVGLEDKAKEIREKWNSLPFVHTAQPSDDYYLAFPNKLMEKIAPLILKGLEEINIPIMTAKGLKELDEKSVRRLLNQAWDKFWEKLEKYRDWEVIEVEKLRKGFYFGT